MFYTFFICLFFSGLVSTIFFRLLAIYKPDSFLNKGNLISLVCSLTYLLLLALAVFFPIEKQTEEVIENKEEPIKELPLLKEEELPVELPVVTTIEETPINNEPTPVIEDKVEEVVIKEEAIITPIVKQEEKKVVAPTITKEDIYNALKELKVDELVKEEISKENNKQKEAAKPTMVLAVFNGPILAQYYNNKEKK